MTPEQFLAVQSQLVSAYFWFGVWWLIMLIVAGVFAIVLVTSLVITKDTLSKL